MSWVRAGADTIECSPWRIVRGWWIAGVCYRLYRGTLLIALCGCVDGAKALAERMVAAEQGA